MLTHRASASAVYASRATSPPPRKTGLRLAGCAPAGRASNLLDRLLRKISGFQVLSCRDEFRERLPRFRSVASPEAARPVSPPTEPLRRAARPRSLQSASLREFDSRS